MGEVPLYRRKSETNPSPPLELPGQDFGTTALFVPFRPGVELRENSKSTFMECYLMQVAF